MDKPLEGPVYLRSSDNPLPDLVAALHGQIDVDLVGRIDSVKGGRIRNTFEEVPDAPVTKFTLTLLGGKRGLLQNGEDLCHGVHRANARFIAQSNETFVSHPKLTAKCHKAEKKKHRKSKSHRRPGRHR